MLIDLIIKIFVLDYFNDWKTFRMHFLNDLVDYTPFSISFHVYFTQKVIKTVKLNFNNVFQIWPLFFILIQTIFYELINIARYLCWLLLVFDKFIQLLIFKFQLLLQRCNAIMFVRIFEFELSFTLWTGDDSVRAF